MFKHQRFHSDQLYAHVQAAVTLMGGGFLTPLCVYSISIYKSDFRNTLKKNKDTNVNTYVNSIMWQRVTRSCAFLIFQIQFLLNTGVSKEM